MPSARENCRRRDPVELFMGYSFLSSENGWVWAIKRRAWMDFDGDEGIAINQGVQGNRINVIAGRAHRFFCSLSGVKESRISSVRRARLSSSDG